MDRRNRGECCCSIQAFAAVTHSPINFGGRSIDHNVLFCSLVFLPAAFDSIRGCGESIYLSRCHEPPVMDGGCSLTLIPKREAVPRTCPVPAILSTSDPDFLLAVFFLLLTRYLPPHPATPSARAFHPRAALRKVPDEVTYAFFRMIFLGIETSITFAESP